MILLLFLSLLPSITSTYPTCGSCWCIPPLNGYGPCPPWKPQEEFSLLTINKYKSQSPLSIYTLDCNPYYNQSCTTTPPQQMIDINTAVCAFKYSSDSCDMYSMITYSSRSDAIKDGAHITHEGSCGLCSTAQDLAIYLTEDFTTSGKKCATKGLFDEAAGLQCYMDIGLTEECAKIWNYDGIYDGKACGRTCLGYITADNNGPPPACSLNPCLQCDEDEAGPIFTSFGGRTRRRSGLMSEIIRPCDTVARILVHNPCPLSSNITGED